jgi:predicted O-methyltransferase YrrM
MIPYIGDISSRDAIVLQTYGSAASHILEFGCGASTQVLRHYSRGSMTSVDTDPAWIKKTQENLALLEIEKPVTFLPYNMFVATVNQSFDLIFDDGVDWYRLEFARKLWPRLTVGGYLLFHDTRRPGDQGNVLAFLGEVYNEVDEVHLNQLSSNITAIRKKAPQPYDNWQISENKAHWELGWADPDVEEVRRRLKK